MKSAKLKAIAQNLKFKYIVLSIDFDFHLYLYLSHAIYQKRKDKEAKTEFKI